MADEALRQADMKKEKQVAKPIKQKPKAEVVKPKVKEEKTEVKKEDIVKAKDDKKSTVNAQSDKKDKVSEAKKTDDIKADEALPKDDKKPEEKKVPTKPKKKMDHATVYGRNLPISLKHAKSIGKFIKGKKIETAIRDLEQVMKKKIAIPMIGELAHKKGKGMMSGKYPVKASENFIKILKSLNANSAVNELDTSLTIVKESIANKAPDQMHRYGRTKFKRTHVKLKSMEGK